MMLKIAGYEIDCAVTEEPSFENEITEYPVEEGSDAVDHVRAKPIRLQIEGVVSDTPIGALRDRRRAVFGGLFNGFHSYEAYIRLLKVRDDREPVTIETSRGVFNNMAMESLTETRNGSSGDAFRFRASFKQVIIRSNERTTIQVSVPRAANKVDRGHQPSLFAPTETPAPPATTAATVDDLAFLRP